MKKTERQYPEYPEIYSKDREKWRSWLEKNHAVSSGVRLVFFKKGSGKPSVSYEEAVQEALSFGWIDSRVDSLDEDRYMQVFTPRNPRSSWSKLNKSRAEKLIKEGRMTPAGLEKVEAAKINGCWDRPDPVQTGENPADLMEALSINREALDHFLSFSPSSRKTILQWIGDAKRPETRRRRIERTAKLAAENKKPFP